MTSPNPIWDAVVIGGGPAGAVAAHVMARGGRQVLLADTPAHAARRTIGETLPGAATPLLRDLGLLPVLQNGPHLPCHGSLSSWGSANLAAVDFIRDPNGPGWRLDRPAFDSDLRAAAERAGAQRLSARFLSVEPEGDHWRIYFRDNPPVEARWIVDATGRRSAVARQMGARRIRDVGLIALCGWFPAHDSDTRTLVEAEPDGWWYTALTPEGSRIVACHVIPEAAPALLHTPGGYTERLAHTFHIRAALADASPFEPIRAVDAGGAHLDRFGGEGWLAVGDAALSFDPLSSQGIFTALYSGMRAGQTILPSLDTSSSSLIDTYTARLESIRTAYLRHWSEAYANETRWPNNAFWAERHASRSK